MRQGYVSRIYLLTGQGMQLAAAQRHNWTEAKQGRTLQQEGYCGTQCTPVIYDVY